jgi:hypothetical protein
MDGANACLIGYREQARTGEAELQASLASPVAVGVRLRSDGIR